MDTNVRGDVITLDSRGPARVPLASKVQVVCALTANMTLTNVLLKGKASVILRLEGRETSVSRLTYRVSGVGNFCPQAFHRQMRLSSEFEMAAADGVEVALDGGGVVDLESLLLLLDPEEGCASGMGGDMVV